MTRRLRRGAIFARAVHKSFREFNRHERKLDHALALGERAQWLTESCRGVLASLSFSVTVSGPMPAHGLIVSNHLSYLDILCFSSIAPCVFVSKSEVKKWPVFGRLATNGGTSYVDRKSKADAGRVAKEIEQALRDGIRVVLFPEGTSSGGDGVLPFHAPLLESAIRAEAPMTPACIGYEIERGDPKKDVCYWGDMTFASHFLGLLGKGRVHAAVLLGRTRVDLDDRKSSAKILHQDVVELHKRLRSAKDEHRVQSAKRK